MPSLARFNPWNRVIGDMFREHALCVLFKRGRMGLPDLALDAWFPDADEVPVSISTMPKGPWAAPVVDLVYLLKLVRLFEPRRVLELGSYRGFVARALAEHMPEGADLVTVDIDPTHGEAYRDMELPVNLDRRVGAISASMFEGDQGSYDFIFVDADHAYGSVKHDTEVALPLLKPTGVMVWHDYANWGAYTGQCGVPEFLVELAQRLPVAHLAGSNMAVHLPAWNGAGRNAFEQLLATTREWQSADHWDTKMPAEVS